MNHGAERRATSIPVLVSILAGDPVVLFAAKTVCADIGDAQQVGCAWSSERHASRNDDPISWRREFLLIGDAAGAIHHVIKIRRILRDYAMRAPDDAQAP